MTTARPPAENVVAAVIVAGNCAEGNVPVVMLLALMPVRAAPEIAGKAPVRLAAGRAVSEAPEPENSVAATVPVTVTLAPNVDAPAVTASPPVLIVTPAANVCAVENTGAVENVHAPVIVAAASMNAA